MTIQKLADKWRGEAQGFAHSKRDKDMRYTLNGCADELASTLAVTNCATCVHRGMSLGNFNDCKFLKVEMPKAINGGQPFSCAAHQPQSDS
jgi:hypothetical protein